MPETNLLVYSMGIIHCTCCIKLLKRLHSIMNVMSLAKFLHLVIIGIFGSSYSSGIITKIYALKFFLTMAGRGIWYIQKVTLEVLECPSCSPNNFLKISLLKEFSYGLIHLSLNWRFPWQSYVVSWEVEVSAHLPSYVLVWSSWSSWLLIEENKKFKFIWTRWTYDTAQCRQMGLHGTC